VRYRLGALGAIMIVETRSPRVDKTVLIGCNPDQDRLDPTLPLLEAAAPEDLLRVHYRAGCGAAWAKLRAQDSSSIDGL